MIDRPNPPTTKLLDTVCRDAPSAASPSKPKLMVGGTHFSYPRSLGGTTYTTLPKEKKSTAIFAGWILLLLGYLLAAVPLLGFLIYLVGFVFCGAALILGIIGAANGKPLSGVALICASVISFFLYLLVPWIVTAVFSAGEVPA